MSDLVVLGCGYTGRRVAERWLRRFPDARVVVTTRHPARLAALAEAGARVLALDALDPAARRALAEAAPEGCAVLHSVPVVAEGGVPADPTPALLEALRDRPSRLVYLSTTGVYGDAVEVDERTPVAPRTPRVRLRVEAERAVTAGPWSSLILRPAAIYGPWRGVHAAMRRGEFRLVEGGQHFISRIHVSDLASLTEAALLSRLQGAYPVADDEPAASESVARFCAELLGLPMPDSIPRDQVSETRRANRRVDGRAIRRLLHVRLDYPSYRTGIPASLAAERDGTEE